MGELTFGAIDINISNPSSNTALLTLFAHKKTNLTKKSCKGLSSESRGSILPQNQIVSGQEYCIRVFHRQILHNGSNLEHNDKQNVSLGFWMNSYLFDPYFVGVKEL